MILPLPGLDSIRRPENPAPSLKFVLTVRLIPPYIYLRYGPVFSIDTDAEII
jgi:hypothetical protein